MRTEEVRQSMTARELPIESFESFIEQERENYSGRAGNSFASAFSQLDRYLHFLRIVKNRHDELSDAVRILSEKVQGMARSQTEDGHATTETEAAIWAQWRDSLERLQLEMESFFSFAYTALTRGAQRVEWYFGAEHGVSFRSHASWTKYASKYCDKKGLVVPGRLFVTLQRCLNEITEPRSHAVVHDFNPRAVFATAIREDGSTSRVTTHVFPTEKDTQSELMPVEDAYVLLSDYVGCFAELIVTNRHRGRFKSK